MSIIRLSAAVVVVVFRLAQARPANQTIDSLRLIRRIARRRSPLRSRSARAPRSACYLLSKFRSFVCALFALIELLIEENESGSR